MPDQNLLLILLLIALVALPVAWRISGQRAAQRYQRALKRLDADNLRSGQAGGGDAESPAEVKAVRERLGSGWMPVREESTQTLSRLAQFLQTAVVKPLIQALHARGRGVRPRIQQALDAIEDIEFYGETPALNRSPADLVAAVEGVARDYQDAFKVEVRLDVPEAPVVCRIDQDVAQDAVYAILANAGRHGGGEPVEVSVRGEGGAARLTVRDSGEGFSEEALARATEPFFSTVPGSLGLGLTHARHVIQAHGGTLAVRNHGGGAEVEVVLPVG